MALTVATSETWRKTNRGSSQWKVENHLWSLERFTCQNVQGVPWTTWIWELAHPGVASSLGSLVYLLAVYYKVLLLSLVCLLRNKTGTGPLLEAEFFSSHDLWRKMTTGDQSANITMENIYICGGKDEFAPHRLLWVWPPHLSCVIVVCFNLLQYCHFNQLFSTKPDIFCSCMFLSLAWRKKTLCQPFFIANTVFVKVVNCMCFL
jgi:hypothetical protein